MLDRVFPSRRRSTAAPRKRREERLHLQRLEERLAMAIEVFQYPTAGTYSAASASSNYAVLLMDDGTTGFLKKNATPAPTFTYANNSQFLDNPATIAQEAVTFGELLSNWGTLSSFYVTSGKRIDSIGTSIPATFLGKDVFIQNVDPVDPLGPKPIDLGTSDGIVPGTFRASASIVDKDGKFAFVQLLASKPGDNWNMTIDKVSGDGAAPTLADVSETTGSVILRFADAPQSVSLSPISWGVYTGARRVVGTTGPTDVKPLSFTLFPGQNVTQRFLVDLSRNESTIAIDSPLLATRGSASDPGFFSNAGEVVDQVGQVVLDGSTIVTNANVSSADLFTIGVPLWFNQPTDDGATTRIPVRNTTINRPVAAPSQQLILEGAVGAPGRLLVSEQGALANSLTSPSTAGAGVLDVQASHADVIFAGTVNATNQTYLLQSPLDPRAYSLTTVSPTSGVQSGRILGSTVGVTLANDAGGEMNVRTTINNLRMTAASTSSQPVLPYAINVADSNDLTVDAVPASSRPIALEAAGSLNVNSAVLTSGDLTLTATTALTMAGPVASAAGNVTLRSSSINSTVPITAGGTRNVSLQARDATTGNIRINSLVQAGGPAKAPVRAATTANVDLVVGGLLVVDGVLLAAGDRVLVKNQTVASENGIYIAAAGAWTRASDANFSQLLVPGFTTAVREGAQQGAWTFANPATPTLDQTALAFVPASAVQTYVPARVATTANVNLAVGGLLTVDGVALAAGDRVLVRNQSNPRQNGLYVADSGAWVRASDADTVPELVAGSYVFVSEGAATGQKGYVLADDAVQVGNTPLTFNPFTVQATRTNNYSPARIQSTVVAATTLNVDLAAPPAEIDGVALAVGDLVLVKNQFDAATNGIYVFTGASLQRWSNADTSDELPRGTVVYVEQGATNANSSWTFDDTIDLLGRTTAGSLQVTGLPSTSYLASGMLVTGPGIPADSKIDLVLSSTSVRLTKAALVTSTTAVLGFMQTAAVAVGTTPLLFVPTGGTAAITAGRTISSTAGEQSSRIVSSTAVLTAGSPVTGTADPASKIDVNSTIGRLVASAPASIDVSDSGAIDLFDLRTRTAGGVGVEAQGTITARSLIATGTTASPADVTLTSLLGDVVAASVSSSVGSINLNSPNERVVVRPLGVNPGAVVAQNGDVTAIANGGGILVQGQVQAGGADGDTTFQSNQAGLTTIAPASITASDRLTVTTPSAVPLLGAGTTVSAKALTLTSQFGASQTPPAGFGTFSTVNFNRTDAGSIVYSSPAALTVEAATTVFGDIELTAPSLNVTGGITAATATPGDGKVSLIATAGNIGVAAPITAGGDRVTLTAAAGVITPSGTGQINSQTLVWTAKQSPLPGLTGTFSRVGSNLTAPGSLTLGSADSPIVIVGASTVSGPITITGSNVRIVEVVRANGGDPVSVTATAGNIEFVANTMGGIVSVPAAATSGAITLSAPAGQVIGANKATRTTVRGGPLTVSAQTADLKTNVSSLASTTSLGGLTASAVGPLTLGDILAPGQNVSLDAVSGVTQPTGGIVTAGLSVANGSGVVNLSSTANNFAVVSLRNGSGDVFLTNSGSFTVAGNGVSTGTAAPGDGDITLTANSGDIVLMADVTAQGDRVTLNAATGSIVQTAGGIDSQTLVWSSTTPPVLTGTYTDIGSNLTGPGDLVLAVSATQRVLATSTANGSITITGPSVTISEPVTAGGAGSGVTAQATAGDITFQPFTSATPSITAPFGGVTLVATGQIDAQYGRVAGQTITSTSGGTLFVGTMQSTSTTTIVTTAGGGVSVSPQPNGLLQAGGTLDLSQVQGQIRIRNGGLIIGNPLVLGGKTVQFATVTTPAELVGAVNAVNLLPSVPGSTYEILVGATMTLTQTLTIDRPVTFRGTSSSIVLSGSPTVTSGLVLTSGASGSTVRDIAFSNFTGTAVRATSLSGLTISGINVLNSGTGVSLSSVTNSLVGGTGAGQGNTFTNNSREGIFATGVCVNTQLVKNSFPGTTTKYNLASSRGITVVN